MKDVKIDVIAKPHPQGGMVFEASAIIDGKRVVREHVDAEIAISRVRECTLTMADLAESLSRVTGEYFSK